jgi:heme exporter protein C
MKGIWWKILGVVLFIYVLIGGMTVALSPGITSIDPSNTKSGDTIIMNITGYNTHFITATNHRAWLKVDSTNAIKAAQILPSTENAAQLTFYIPATFPSKDKVQPMSLIIDNDVDGAFVQPNAIFVSLSDSALTKTSVWPDAALNDFHTAEGIRFPYRTILYETIRNTFFHVALWFAMFILLIVGLYHAIQYLRTGLYDHDIQSAAYNRIAIMYGILGLISGSIWAKFTWNTFWTTDVKLNMSAVAMLIYLAYLVLRGASTDHDKRAKTSAAYSIFAFLALIPLVFVIPRLTDSLHPGNGGNPALGGEDLDHTLRLFFYPSIIALILLGSWMSSLLTRYERLKEQILMSAHK